MQTERICRRTRRQDAWPFVLYDAQLMIDEQILSARGKMRIPAGREAIGRLIEALAEPRRMTGEDCARNIVQNMSDLCP